MADQWRHMALLLATWRHWKEVPTIAKPCACHATNKCNKVRTIPSDMLMPWKAVEKPEWAFNKISPCWVAGRQGKLQRRRSSGLKRAWSV
eukprot:scaffold20972_cov20-Tisochrysis_lutea.AAC.3